MKTYAYRYPVKLSEEQRRFLEKEMQQLAEDENAECIELALCWAASEKDLHRLNWEMMRSREGFLMAGRGKSSVAITRLVAGTSQLLRLPNWPLRVLFVVDSSIDDPSLRPGAEYLGLLRHLKRNRNRLYACVLENATPSRLIEVMDHFRPDVVHFICKSYIDPASNRQYLELASDEQGTYNRHFGDQLLQYLRVYGDYPPIVVLSACYSSTAPNGVVKVSMMGAYQIASLVTELVQGGVPLVVGLAGRISNLACRLFTHRFGEALLLDESLVKATAEARRATFAPGVPPQGSVDWAFPAIFMAENVDPDYPLVVAGDFDSAEQIEHWIKSYDVERMPVFCGREEFFQAYYDFFSPGVQRLDMVDNSTSPL